MKYSKNKNIVAMMACLVMILPQSGFSGDGTQWASSPTQTYKREVPALQENNPKGSDRAALLKVAPPAKEPVMDSWRNPSPLSLPEGNSGEPSKELTEEESAAVLERTNQLISMALESLKKQRESFSGKSGKAYEALNAEIKKYEEAQAVLNAFFQTKAKSSGISMEIASGKGSLDKGETAYKTLKNVGDILGRESPKTKDAESSSLTSPKDLFQRFVSDAVASVQKVRQQMTDDASLPEAKIFSAEESPTATREELPALSQELNRPVGKDYQVLGSVVLNREMAKTYELLNPPQKLQPFLRWLFYGRHLTQVRAERYLAARAKVREICLRAKAGEGLIRYRGKIMEMFLPLPGDENGMAFELVRRM